MPTSPPVFLAHCMRRILPVLWPVDWRVVATRSGLYCVEGQHADGWRLMALSFNLADAFALGEALHSGPERAARLCRRGEADALPESYRVSTEEGWSGGLFRAAVLDGSFAPDIGPHQLFRSQAWRRSLKQTLKLLGRGEKAILLGEPGIGKTLFLRDLAQALAFEGRRVAVLGPADPLAGQAEIVLVDDADRLGQNTLDGLLSQGVPALFAFPPGCEGAMAKACPAASIIRLEPLAIEDVARFVVSRPRCAGREPGPADAAAVLALARLSGGVPRRLASLAGAATFLADIECSPRLLVRHVEHAAAIARPGGIQLRPAPAKPARPVADVARKSAWARARLGIASMSLAVALVISWVQQTEQGADIAPWAPSGSFAATPADFTPVQLAETEPESPAASASAELAARHPAARSVADKPQAAPAAEPSPSLAPARSRNVDRAANRRFDGGVSVVSGVQAEQTESPSAAIGRMADADAAEEAAEPGLGSVLAASLGSFQGSVNNETLRLTGKLSLDVMRSGIPGVVRARFHAWDGLLGTGELTGTLSPDGRLTLSGQLSMGRNPFICRLTGVIKGDRITGAAQFVRPWGGRVAHSSFNLVKA